MKKNFALAAGFVAFASLASGMANAAGTALPSTNKITKALCSLLAEDVTITPSKNVLMAYDCDTATTMSIDIAACHTAGRTTSRTELVPCDADPATTAIPACATPPATINTTGANIYVANSNGGKVQPGTYVNNEKCDATSVAGKI